MYTTMIAKIAAKMNSTHWLEGLSVSLASFLAVAQPQWRLCYASRHHSKALYAAVHVRSSRILLPCSSQAV